MNCDEFKEHAAAYALRSLDANETEECARHIRMKIPHTGCVEIYRQARSVTLKLADALVPATLPQTTWQKIEQSLPLRPSLRPREAAAWGLAAAAVIASLFIYSADLRRRGQLERQVLSQSQALTLIAMPDNRSLVLTPQGNRTESASLIINRREKRAFVLVSAIHQPADKELELWVIRGRNAPVAAGMMHAMSDGMLMGEVTPNLLAEEMPDAIAVSMEPVGGRATPTEVVWVAALKS